MDIERLKELSDCGRELYMLNDENLMERIQSDNQLQNYLSDSVDAIDAAIARQSEIEKVVCPDCGGSGVYQEYDEYDRYHVYSCGICGGSGEVDLVFDGSRMRFSEQDDYTAENGISVDDV